MKRIISGILIVLFALVFTACQSPAAPKPADGPAKTEEPAEEPTEAPVEEPTEEPVEEPTEEPVEEPTEEPAVGVADLCIPLELGKEVTVDLDFDGVDDTVLLREERQGEYDNDYILTITPGSGSNTIEYPVANAYDCQGWVLDCDAGDGRLEVVIDFVQDSEDYTCKAYRVNAAGSGFDEYEEGYCILIDGEHPFTTEGGFTADRQHDILGTTFLRFSGAVGENGFKALTPMSYNGYPEGLELKRDMEFTVVNEDGSLGEKITVPAGETIAPYETDGESYVDVRMPDGRIGRAEVKISTGDEWCIYINGVDQDEYANIPYAD